MKKALVMLSVMTLGVAAQAQEMGRVVSVTPINQSVPQQVCNQQYISQPTYGANPGNAIIGAVAGGLLGSAIGGRHGYYSGANIALGSVTGAVIGSQVNSGVGYVSQPVQNCYTTYQNNVSSYNVVYEVAGRTYSTTTNYYPGQYISLNNTGYNNSYNAPVYTPPVYTTPVYAAPVYAPPIYRAPPVYLAPPSVYYGPRYYGGHHGRW